MARRGRAPPGTLPGTHGPRRQDHRHARLRQPPPSRPLRTSQALLTPNKAQASLESRLAQGARIFDPTLARRVSATAASGNSGPPAWPAGGQLLDDLVVLVRTAHQRRRDNAICRDFAFPPPATSGPRDVAPVS